MLKQIKWMIEKFFDFIDSLDDDEFTKNYYLKEEIDRDTY